MKNLKILSSEFLVTKLYLLIIFSPYAGAAPPPPPPAECEAALVTSNPTDMDFGSYVGGTTGTIAMPALGGAMVYSGVIPVGAGTGVAATFDLTTTQRNCRRLDLTITLPASITILNGGVPITINNLVMDPTTNPIRVRRNRTYTLSIGGTLQAVAGDAPGPYTGPFDVFFTY